MVKAGRTYRLITDHVGSVRLVVDAASGAVMQRLDYDAFGRLTRNTSPGFQPFGFAGGLFDDDTKLTHFGARDYDAATGGWISADPILFEADGSNLYAYVGSDPVNDRDPSGLETLAGQNAKMDIDAELKKNDTRRALREKREVLRQLCKTIEKIENTNGQVHHLIFKVFGGGDEGNLLWLATPVHRAFHEYFGSWMKLAGLPGWNIGQDKYVELLQNDPATRERVKKLLLHAAKKFDQWCAGHGRQASSYPRRNDDVNGPYTGMEGIMRKYFESNDWPR